MIRPEVAALLHRGREVIGCAAALLLGLWIFARGGWFFGALGIAVALTGLGLGVIALQRLRFAPGARGPGVVEIDEGQIAWFGPGIGGVIALAELSELGLATVAGLRVWRFRQSDGQVLLVPVAAEGAGQLFDALAALPGLDPRDLLAALERDEDSPALWRRGRVLKLVPPRP